MKRNSLLPKLATFAGAGVALLLSSCALPLADASRMIANEGPLSYGAYEVRSCRIPPPANAWERRAPSIPYTTSLLGPGPTLTAPSVPGAGSLVRSPYTYPPRFVDVGGAAPGTVIICPHTLKPFIVPSSVGYAYSGVGRSVGPSQSAKAVVR
jgi:hypothetical protein